MAYFSPSMLCSEPGMFCGSPGTPQCKWNSTALYFLPRPPPPTLGDVFSVTLTGGKKPSIVLKEKIRSYINSMWEQRCSWDSNLSSSSHLAFQTECSRNSALQKPNSYKIIAEINLRWVIAIMTCGVWASYTSQKTQYSFISFQENPLYQSKFDPSLFGF